MWLTLLDDIDELGDYLGGDPYETSPLLPAWEMVDIAIRALVPDTIPAATAIAFAAQRDADVMGWHDWEDDVVAEAKARALPNLERPR